MWDRLKIAAADGCVLGVKWAIALVIVTFVLSWIAQDYQLVRQQARNGQMAFQLVRQLQQQKAQAP